MGTLPAQDRGTANEALNVQNADIRAFIQDVARATGTTFIVDPQVQGTVNVSREQPMSEQELLGVLLAVLRANGLVAIPAGGGAYRVVPDDTAAQQPGSAGGSSLGFATQVIPLRTVDARIAAETLKPLVGRGGVVLPMPQSNSLLVADYADNLRRIRQLIAQVDSDRASIDTVTLRNSSAREIAATVGQLFGVGGEGGNPALSILPVESSNSVVIRGDNALIQRVAQMVMELDRRAESSGDVRVVKLRHANAEELLPVLQQLIGQSNGDAPRGDQPVDTAVSTADAQIISGTSGKRPTIVRYPGSNSLIINADPETQRTLMAVIEQLDTRREQVLVEAIVVEISDEAAKELGVQFLLAGKDGNLPFAATQYPSSDVGIMNLAAGVAAQQKDDDSAIGELAKRAAVQSLLGLTGGLAGLAGSSGDAVFGMIINAVKSDTGSNLLSTPSILTLDNEEARILVGQEVPITTGEVLGNDNSNPFRTIQRQDVGIQLEVKPQVNSGGGITLFLRQEVSSIAGPVSADFSELVLNKREIETRVQVDDGAIVVLGGLLDQADRLTVDKIPGLGDIPVIGGLFRSTSRQNTQRNLVVFIRPSIIRDGVDAQRATAQRYDYIRNVQLQSQDAEGQRAALDALVEEYLRASPPVQPPSPVPSLPPASEVAPREASRP
ncbi:type II secretion system secretin GspD [Lysobacter sp. SG-8]|uniref:Type II secretion system secretin GspD n=1 Tax=Marilutibacter penaei TaxID=2759900 RepID=A0A7W3YFJ6_9GAMM|nr:type II secretion system secretin GspD [Lysobacter penaei]MBB1089341.1 type II secretion system secretin GspD [Lysobacter penaei]